MNIRLDQVIVKERIREEIGEEEIVELMTSFVALGQLQPIVVREDGDGAYELVAGERRLIAAKRLHADGKAIKFLDDGLIKAEFFESMPPRVQLMMEFDENMKRKDFTYVEKAKFIRRFHETMTAEVGDEWKDQHTAAALRLSPASISHYLRIEEAIKTDPMVAKAVTLAAAVKRMKIAEQQRARQLEVKKDDEGAFRRAGEIIRLGNAFDLIKSVPDQSVDFINFDPPWGDDTGHKSNQNWDGFDDDTETSDRIINGLLPELFRVLKQDRALVFWYRAWAYSDMLVRLEKVGFHFKFTRTPCIWYKPDKVSDQNRFPEKQMIESYETFLIARKGEPLLHERNRQNVFVFNRVPQAALIHPTEKPVDLCSDLVRLLTIPGELILDPTAGSAAILHAALKNNRKALGFELSESIHARSTTRIAEYLKTIRQAEIQS